MICRLPSCGTAAQTGAPHTPALHLHERYYIVSHKMTTLADLRALKVAELRNELTTRGLDTKGVKEELLQRLWEAISGDAPAEGDVATTGTGDDSADATEVPAESAPEEDAVPAEVRRV